MAMSFNAERRLLAQDELAIVAASHYPHVAGLAREELVSLARLLRERRDRAGAIVRDRRRIRRGKAPGAEPPAERGMAAKKQVFAHALRRVNGRLEGAA